MKYFIVILYSVFSISAYAGGMTSMPAKSLINHEEPTVNKTLTRFDRFVNTIGGSVSRAAFTRAVVNREPIDTLKRLRIIYNISIFLPNSKVLWEKPSFIAGSLMVKLWQK